MDTLNGIYVLLDGVSDTENPDVTYKVTQTFISEHRDRTMIHVEGSDGSEEWYSDEETFLANFEKIEDKEKNKNREILL